MTKVNVVIGAGSIGQAIVRRVSADRHVLLADIQQENADADVRTERLSGGVPPLVLDAAASFAAQPSVSPGTTLPLLDAAGDVLPLEAVEAAAIRFAIGHYRGQMSEVARKLRIGRSTLYRKIEHLGLAPGAGKADVAGR